MTKAQEAKALRVELEKAFAEYDIQEVKRALETAKRNRRARKFAIDQMVKQIMADARR